jgi:hypothetical protein
VKCLGAWPRRPQSVPFMAGRESHFVGPSLGGGEVHHQDPLSLERRLVPHRHVQLDRGSDLLIDECASSWPCLFLDGGLSSAGLHSLPLLMSAPFLKREVGIGPRCRLLRWNPHHGRSGQSVLHAWCGCHGSGWSPHAAPPERGKARAPLPT